MNRAALVQLARQAGAFPELSETPEKDVAFLERFARLVAAAEREACAKLCETTDDGTPYNLAKECATAIRARGQT